MLPFIYVQYYFGGNKQEINCDETRKRSKTTFSTQKALEENKSLKGKKGFHKVLSSVSGFKNARTVADIPRNYKQVGNVAQQRQSEKELIEILDLCRGQERTRNAFIGDVHTAPKKSKFLAINAELVAIER